MFLVVQALRKISKRREILNEGCKPLGTPPSMNYAYYAGNE
jgi:hypothetical protein